MKKKYGFTLLEVLIAMTVFVIIMTMVLSIYLTVYKMRRSLEGRQTLAQDSYFLLEKMQTMMKDYTIDYEEYWNRQNVGCVTANDSLWNTGGNCTMMTYYGNKNKIDSDSNYDYRSLYGCSSYVDILKDIGDVLHPFSDNECDLGIQTLQSGFIQSYGQYRMMFIDVKDNVDYDNKYGGMGSAIGDDDDEDLGNGPDAIFMIEDNYPQELYLISHDGQRRMFIRRKFVNDRYTLQLLQLRGFDAGDNHRFDAAEDEEEEKRTIYDGVIDTWACDYGLGFECTGTDLGSDAFSGYRLPADSDDGWQDLLSQGITLSDWKLEIYPLKNPNYAWNDPSSRINPYVRIGFVAQLSRGIWEGRLSDDELNTYALPLETQFNLQ